MPLGRAVASVRRLSDQIPVGDLPEGSLHVILIDHFEVKNSYTFVFLDK